VPTPILVLNCGSSSIKYQVIDVDDESRLATGLVQKIGLPDSSLDHTTDGETHRIDRMVANHQQALELIVSAFGMYGPPLADVVAVGHRAVHGGEAFRQPVRIDDTGTYPAYSAPVIDIEGVHKLYRTGSLEVAALRGVSLTIAAGEYVALMGPSGSGKSTLMHILGCLDVPTSGSYRLAGEDVSAMTEIELAEVRNRRIGFVFQQFNLLASLPAWRNVELPLVYAGVDRSTRKQRALAALDRVGMGDRVEHRPGELSGGQQQRVALARAVVSDPALILADEPTGNLDSASAREVLDLLAELHDSGRTVVLITHDAEVAETTSRTLRIRDGQILGASSASVTGGVA